MAACYRIIIFSAFLLALLCTSKAHSIDLRFQDRLQKGEAALKSLQVRAKDRTASSCWLTALQTLIESCKSMDEILRSKFAVQLANCHLQASGLKTFPCTSEMSVFECTEPLAANAIAFNTYTEFFIHSDHICYYIESENLQDRMERNVAELIAASSQVTRDVQQISSDLNSIGIRQMEIVDGQIRIQDLQQHFAEQTNGYLRSIHSKADEMSRELSESLSMGAEMRETQLEVILQLDDVQVRQNAMSEIVTATRSAQEELFEQQKHFAKNQSRMHSEVSDRVDEILGKTQSANSNLQEMINVQSKSFSQALDTVEKLSRDAQAAQRLQQSFIQSLEKVISLQEFLLGEVFDMKALAFYLISILVTFLFTSCERLSAARFWLFLIFSGSFVMERLIVRYYVHFESLSETLWLCRKLTLAVCVLLLIVFSLRYKDTSGKLLELMDSHDSTLRYLRTKEEQRSLTLSDLVQAQQRLLERCDLLETQHSTRPKSRLRV